MTIAKGQKYLIKTNKSNYTGEVTEIVNSASNEFKCKTNNGNILLVKDNNNKVILKTVNNREERLEGYRPL